MTDLKRCDNCRKLLEKGKDNYLFLGWTSKGSAFWGIPAPEGETFCDQICLEEYLKKWREGQLGVIVERRK